MEERRNSAETIRSLYWEGCAFPEWIIHPTLWNKHIFSDTCVFYHREDNIEHVKRLMLEREPCNIGMRRLYDGEALEKVFGWKYGAYGLQTDSSMPNIAVYCNATIHTDKKGFFQAHVLNLIGCALDSPRQPDFIQYNSKEKVLNFYRDMWRLSIEAVKSLKKSKFQIYNVGGGAFSGQYSYRFIEDIFEPSFLPLLPEFEAAGIQVLGYNAETKRFTGGRISECLNEESQDLENTVYVNAWDPWSLIGNGNECDNSLDGYWGRCSNMSVLGWLKTNPDMKFIGV